jgi:protein phosphatase
LKTGAAYFTNVGNVRSRNEDGLLLDHELVAGTNMTTAAFAALNGDKHTLIVVDGLGGHVGGELATRTVLEAFRRNSNRLMDDLSLLDLIGKCKSDLNRKVKADPDLFSLGATTAGIIIGNGHGITAFNCGDCRVYHMSDGILRRVTRDHSVVQQLFEQGEIGEEDIMHHPHKNIVTSCLVGNLDSESPEVFTCDVAVKSGDRFLVCSDGVWEIMDGTELNGIIAQHPIQEAANVLAQKVMEYGARDNVTFIIAEIV